MKSSRRINIINCHILFEEQTLKKTNGTFYIRVYVFYYGITFRIFFFQRALPQKSSVPKRYYFLWRLKGENAQVAADHEDFILDASLRRTRGLKSSYREITSSSATLLISHSSLLARFNFQRSISWGLKGASTTRYLRPAAKVRVLLWNFHQLCYSNICRRMRVNQNEEASATFMNHNLARCA